MTSFRMTLTEKDLRVRLLSTNYFEEGQFLDSYCTLVSTALASPWPEVSNRHHILPIACSRLLGQPIDDTFVVRLSPAQHAFAHYLLALCTTGELRYKMRTCFLRMSGNNRFVENLTLESLTFLDSLKQEQSQAFSEWRKTFTHSADVRKRFSELSKARWADPSYRSKVSAILRERAASMTPEARKQKSERISKSKKGTKCSFRTAESNAKGLKTKLEKYGTLAISEETKKKISSTLKGHPVSEETRRKLSQAAMGRVPWNKGKKLK